jgi:Protein of unknown function (DUF1275)
MTTSDVMISLFDDVGVVSSQFQRSPRSFHFRVEPLSHHLKRNLKTLLPTSILSCVSFPDTMIAVVRSPLFALCLILTSIIGGLADAPPPTYSVTTAALPANTIIASTVAYAAFKDDFAKRQKTAFTTTTATGMNVSHGGAVSSSLPSKQQCTQALAIAAGFLLAFNSGFINGACLGGFVAKTKSGDSFKQAVAAVTGAWTTSALFFADGKYEAFRTQISVLASYITGSCLAGLMNPFPTAFGTLSPSCGPAFLLGSLLLAASSHLSKTPENALTAFCLAAIVNGMQNSMTSMHTSNMIRTAHYSGMSSDMGTFLGQVLRGNKANLLKLKVFAGLGLSFWTGGFVAFHVAQKFGSESLLFSSGLYMLLFLILSSWK